jgi:hypothetical protein
VCLAIAIGGAMVALAAGCSEEAETRPRVTSDSAADDRGASSVDRVKSMAQHAIHANAAEPVGCEDCHEKLAGQYLQAKSWRCEKCHAEARLVLHATAPEDSDARECWSCHDFTSTDKTPTACASCHARAQGSLAAIAAHDPNQPNEDCGSCHRAHQEPSLVEGASCESCHDQTKVSGHAKPDIQITGCASCHGYHEKAETASGRCTNCHRQSRALVSVHATFEGGHEQCVTCHEEHAFEKSEVLGCRDKCHDKVVALSERKVEEHRGCIGCHDKHDVLDSPQQACQQCHDRIRPKHPEDRGGGGRCAGCHRPHRGAGAPLAVACSSCHDNAQSERDLHQGAARRGPRCRDCHEPHGFKLTRTVGLCAGCHGKRPFKSAASIRTHAKHSDCFACHGDEVAHQPAGKRAACASCHKERAATTRKEHRDCVGCHNPHTTEQEHACSTCHEQQAAVARKAHKNCVGCHEPHSTRQKKQCRSCHGAEARTAPREHRDCMQCHDQHSTLVVKKCAECHQDRATGIHAPVAGGCTSCHRPHGPKGRARPPACTSCHDRALPGLHEVAQHNRCTTCHRSHGAQPFGKTATCLGCHTEMRDHEPDATTCIGCHLFGGAK